MQLVVNFAYGVLILALVVQGLFVVYHLAKYSASRAAALSSAVLFLVVFGVLLLTNLALFASIEWREVFPYF